MGCAGEPAPDPEPEPQPAETPTEEAPAEEAPTEDAPVDEAPALAGNELKPEIRAILREAPTLELLALHPSPRRPAEAPGAELLHDYPILGRTTLGPQERTDILAQLERGIRENGGGAAFCFNPRHALVASGGAARVELVICFECLQIEVYREGEQAQHLLTTDSPAEHFNQQLKAAGIAVQRDE